MDERITAALALLPGYAAQHVLLSAVALGLGVVISLPLAIVAARRPRLRASRTSIDPCPWKLICHRPNS